MLLSLDAGEREAETEELWSLVDLLNCACAGHAGDDASMSRVAAFCGRTGVRLGAHPSYPDRERFGRHSPFAKASSGGAPGRGQAVSRQTLALVSDSVAAQCRALAGVAARHGVVVTAVKLHGALYHDATDRRDVADAALRAASDVLGTTCLVVGPPGGAQPAAAQSLGLPYAREGFADRRMYADGSLVARTEPDALITEPQLAAQQVRRLLANLDIISIHADTPHVLDIARAVRGVLRD